MWRKGSPGSKPTPHGVPRFFSGHPSLSTPEATAYHPITGPPMFSISLNLLKGCMRIKTR